MTGGGSAAHRLSLDDLKALPSRESSKSEGLASVSIGDALVMLTP